MKVSGTRLILVALGLFLLAMVMFGIHGFSIPAWHDYIDGLPWHNFNDGSAHNEVLFGDARRIRSDDYAAVLPKALSQITHRPPFPKLNTLIGDGCYNMMANYAMPVWDIVVLFRPQVWGYFLSADCGLAFQWWFHAIGAWLALFLLLKVLTHGDSLVSCSGATALLFSPFFQYWSLNCAPTIIFSIGTLLSARTLWKADTFRNLVAATLALAWFTTAFLLTFSFMPYLVTTAYFIAFLFPGMIVTSPKQDHGELKTSLRVAGLASAVSIMMLVVAYFFIENRDVIDIVRNTAYPGRRVTTGGDETVVGIFRGSFDMLFQHKQWGRYGNICAGAAFCLFFPLTVLAIVIDWLRTRRRPTGVTIGLVAYLLFLMVWNLIGFPETLAYFTGMNRTPPARALLGLGVADTLLLAVYTVQYQRPSHFAAGGMMFAWFLFCGLIAMRLPNEFHHGARLILAEGILAALGVLVVVRPRWVLPVVAIIYISTTVGFNPLVRGGSNYLFTNPLSSKILELDRSSQAGRKSSVWIAYSDSPRDFVLPNLFRILGIKAINGLHSYPQVRLWRTLDPERRYENVWNRYAYVTFGLPSESANVGVELVQKDLIWVELHPQNPRFTVLSVDYLFYSGKHAEQFETIPNLRKVFEYAGKTIFEVKER